MFPRCRKRWDVPVHAHIYALVTPIKQRARVLIHKFRSLWFCTLSHFMISTDSLQYRSVNQVSFSLSPIFEALRLWGLPTWQINGQEKNIELPVNYLKDLIWFPEWETDSLRGDQCPRPNSPRLVFERKSCCENKDWSRREQKNEKVQLLPILRSTLDSHWLNYVVI